MEANKAPEKIYISYEGYGVFGEDGSTERTKISQIEYTRTDAFIEKACEWLNNWFTDDSCKCGIPITKTARAIFFNNFRNYMKENKLPEKYKTCDWLWNYGSISLTKEHIERLNNAINILESVYEYTDANYLKEITDKLLEDKPEPNIVKIDTDAFIEKATEWLKKNADNYTWYNEMEGESGMIDEFIDDFKKYLKGE